MKKIVSLMLAVLLCLTFTACGGEAPAEETTTPVGAWYSTDGVTWTFTDDGILVLSQDEAEVNATWHMTEDGILISYGQETTNGTFSIEGDTLTLVNHVGDTKVMVRMGSDAQLVAEFVHQNRAGLLERMEALFTSGTEDLSFTSSVEAKGTGFVITLRIPALDSITDGQTKQMKETVAALQSAFDQALISMQEGLPQLTYFTVNVCDSYNYTVATVTSGK